MTEQRDGRVSERDRQAAERLRAAHDEGRLGFAEYDDRARGAAPGQAAERVRRAAAGAAEGVDHLAADGRVVDGQGSCPAAVAGGLRIVLLGASGTVAAVRAHRAPLEG